MPRSCRSLLLILLTAAAAPAAARAQSLWLDPAGAGGFQLEFLHPSVDGYSAASGAVFFGLRAPLGRRVALVGELPVAHGDIRVGVEGVELRGEAVTPGNPWIGVEIGSPGSDLQVALGGRIALIDSVDAATSIGFLADPIDRPEAFLAQTGSLTARVIWRGFDDAGRGVLLHGGVSGWIPTDDGETVLQGSYGARLALAGPVVSAVAGITGRANLSADDRSLAERTLHQLGLAVALELGPLRPGAEIRFHLDENFRDGTDWVLGLFVALRTS